MAATDHKKVEIELNESEKRFRALLDTFHGGFYMAQVVESATGQPADLRMLYTNSMYYHLVPGSNPDETIGRSFRELFPDQPESWFQERIQLAVSGGTHKVEWFYPGNQRWYESRHYSSQAGQLATVFYDVTDRIRTEQRVSLAIEAAQALFWEHDIVTDQVRFDASELLRLGLDNDEALRTGQGWLECTHPDDQQSQRANRAARYQQEASFHFEYRVANRAGEYQWIRHTGRVAERAEDGSPLLAIGMSININAQKAAEAALRESEELHRSIVLDQTEFIARYRPDGTIVYMNELYARFLGKSVPDVIGWNWQAFVDPAIVGEVEAAMEALTPDNSTIRMEGKVISASGEWRWIQSDNRGKFNASGKLIEIQAVSRDITERKQAELALLAREAQLYSFVQQAPAAMAMFDSDMKYLAVSQRWRDDYELGDRDLTGHSHYEIFPTIPERWREIHRKGLAGEAQFIEEDAFEHADGSIYWVRWSVNPWLDAEGTIGGIIILAEDVSVRKAAEARIEQLAYRDSLTDLPNRVLLRDRVEQSIAAAHRNGETIALLFLDLDHFKYVNDSFGHAVGDRMLKEVADTLQGAIRDADTVGRLGGDEFLLVLPGADADAAAQVAEKLLRERLQYLIVEFRSLKVSASIGIAIYPKDGSSFDDLLKAADTAMYRAKAEGRNAFRFYTEKMNEAVFQHMVLESNLHRAIEKNELLLHYQPKFNLKDRTLVGAEALIRWHHPEMGMISPGKFIPVAESTGLIMNIGQWVLEETCRQIRAWADQGLPSVRVAVNFSSRQFAARNVVEVVTGALQKFGLDGEVLEMEITESLLAQDMDYTLGALAELRKLGVRIAVDDFGTGYSSLSYLKRFPIDRLKIDQSFVCDLESDPNDRAIATAVVTLGHSLGMKVIAEGVETAEQMEILKLMECDEIQGYYLGHPMSAGNFSELLKKMAAE